MADLTEIDRITRALRILFPSFGGGRANPNNPVSIAQANEPASFAANVPIADVVRMVIELHEAFK